MSWRKFENHKAESREVKRFMISQGYQNVKVGHGRGTAWGWLEVSISIPRPADCYCHDPLYAEGRKEEMSTSCRNCGNEWQRVRQDVLKKLMEFTGRRGDYNGDITFNSAWLEAVSEKVDHDAGSIPPKGAMTMNREELEQLSEEALDEMVHDLKGHEAAEINNRGKDAQIAYILGE